MHATQLFTVCLATVDGHPIGAPLATFYFESHAKAFHGALCARWVAHKETLETSAPTDAITAFATKARIPLKHLRDGRLHDYGFAIRPLALSTSLEQAIDDFDDGDEDPADANNQSDADAASLSRDAARWRALMSSQRFKLMGSAGFEYEKIDEASERTFDNLRAVAAKEHLHFGIEVWNTHAAYQDPRYPDRFERELLTSYVDTLIERAKTAP